MGIRGHALPSPPGKFWNLEAWRGYFLHSDIKFSTNYGLINNSNGSQH